jgi:type I restriction enzyme S subunit
MTVPPRTISRNLRWQIIGRTDFDLRRLRLDATSYCYSGSEHFVDIARVATSSLADLAHVRQPTVFGKRQMIGSPSHGLPLFSSSEMLMQQPEPAYFLSRRFQGHLTNTLAVSADTILITRTGSIGFVILVPRELNGALVDDNIIRVIAKHPTDTGFLYSFLRSPIGQDLIQRLSYGAVQNVFHGSQLAELPVPQVSESIREHVNDLIALCSSRRTEANSLNTAAIQRAVEINSLPDAHALSRREIVGERKALVFPIEQRRIVWDDTGTTELRLDAHFHNPAARSTIEAIQKCPSERRTVGELALHVIMGGRFKRNYVESEFGTPFLSGKNIVQTRPTDLKYLSSTQTEGLDDMLIKKGWILVTCSGTIGRTCFVWHNFEDYAASQHILRIIPNEHEVDAGYLYAFLSSAFGYEQIVRFRYGSVIDEITDEQLKKVIVPLAEPRKQKEVGDAVRLAFEKRAEALKLEDEAQQIIMREINRKAAKET